MSDVGRHEAYGFSISAETVPQMMPVGGVQLAAIAAGLRHHGRDDLMMAKLAAGTRVAGVLTRSKIPSAPVTWCREILARGAARALVANSGNANVFTGPPGIASVTRTARATAKLVACKPYEVYVASTGQIAKPLPVERIIRALPILHHRLGDDAWEGAARAIMTTDTFPKGATLRTEIDGTSVTISGIAKGSGMVAPDMATMLAFIFTDARLPAGVIRALLRGTTARSFNSITVDGDTSTSDICLVFATGRVRHRAITRASDPHLERFRSALETVMIDLAQGH